MKHLLLITLVLLFTGSMQSKSYMGVSVTLTDGAETVIPFSGQPKVTITDGKLIIMTETATAEFDRSTVARFSFVSETTGVDEAMLGNNTIVKDGGSLCFNNLADGSVVKIYTADGQLVKNISASGSFTLNLDGFSAGVYIVSVNGVSTKIALTR